MVFSFPLRRWSDKTDFMFSITMPRYQIWVLPAIFFGRLRQGRTCSVILCSSKLRRIQRFLEEAMTTLSRGIRCVGELHPKRSPPVWFGREWKHTFVQVTTGPSDCRPELP